MGEEKIGEQVHGHREAVLVREHAVRLIHAGEVRLGHKQQIQDHKTAMPFKTVFTPSVAPRYALIER